MHNKGWEGWGGRKKEGGSPLSISRIYTSTLPFVRNILRQAYKFKVHSSGPSIFPRIFTRVVTAAILLLQRAELRSFHTWTTGWSALHLINRLYKTPQGSCPMSNRLALRWTWRGAILSQGRRQSSWGFAWILSHWMYLLPLHREVSILAFCIFRAGKCLKLEAIGEMELLAKWCNNNLTPNVEKTTRWLLISEEVTCAHQADHQQHYCW